jgi:hypothetical protein
MAVPEAAAATEGGEAAFSGDPGSGQDEEAVLGSEVHLLLVIRVTDGWWCRVGVISL